MNFEIKDVNFGVDNKSAEFLAKFPFGRVPTFENAQGECLYESSAIAFYAASHKPEFVGGSCTMSKALIQQYLAVCDTEISPAVAGWIYPILGYAAYNEAAFKKAQEDVHRTLAVLDKVLAPRTYLVGEQITLADTSVACALWLLYKLVLDASARQKYVNLTRWFVTVVNQAKFKSVAGEFELCTNAAVYDASKSAAKPAPAKPAPAAVAAADDDEEAPVEKPKEKNPLDLLPPTKLNLEEWKRFYSNNETRPTALNWFWEHYDPEGYSIWRVDYKYNDELAKIFMTCNLVNGLFQRMERLRKYCFASMIIFGEDNNNSISGYMVFRGKEIPPEMIDVADYDSYTFARADTNDAKTRELINDYFAWDGDLEGKTFNQGKIFK